MARMPEPNNMALLGSGELPPGPVPSPAPTPVEPSRMKDSEGTVPSEFWEAEDGPELSDAEHLVCLPLRYS
jgi:hypothetical protein